MTLANKIYEEIKYVHTLLDLCADHLDEPLQVHLSVFPKEFWMDRGYEVLHEEYNSTAKVNNILYKKVFE